MNHRVILSIFLLLNYADAKSMQLDSYNFQDDVICAIACQIAARNDELELRVKDLRNLTRVNKVWNKVMATHINIILDVLASTIQLYECDTDLEGGIQAEDYCEASKVAAAIELGTGTSRRWIEKNYEGKELYKKLLFKLVKYPSAIQYISKLQCLNSFCNRIANEQTNALLQEIEKANVPKNLSMQILNTRKVKYAEIEVSEEKVLKTILNSNIDESFRLLLLKQAIKKNIDCLNNRAKNSSHLFWCDAIDTQELPILKEILRYADKMEACENDHGNLHHLSCGSYYATPLEKMIIVNRPDLVAEVLSCKSITSAEKVGDSRPHPLILALKQNCWVIAKQLIAHPACDINVDYRNETPLIICIENNYFEIASLLIAQPRCDVNKAGKQNRTPLMFAVLDGNVDAIDLLFNRQDIILDKKDALFKGRTAYDIAIDLGYDEIGKKIKEKKCLRLEEEQKKPRRNYWKILRNSSLLMVPLLLIGYFKYI